MHTLTSTIERFAKHFMYICNYILTVQIIFFILIITSLFLVLKLSYYNCIKFGGRGSFMFRIFKIRLKPCVTDVLQKNHKYKH